MSKIDNSIIYYEEKDRLSILEHPKIPNKPHLSRCGKDRDFLISMKCRE
jgi:hypothetical protein